MNIHDSMLDLVGKTPLVYLDRLAAGLPGRVAAKLESRNPGFSVKDRIALNMIERAEAAGELAPGQAVVEPTSGNTGIGLALVCAVKGYPLILTMPESMSAERKKLLAGFGSELVLTPAAEGMKGAIKRARELQAERGAFMPRQFDNPANPEAHVLTTAEEIWKDTDATVDVFVAGVGTGGTITGVGRALKKRKPALTTIAVEPAASPVLSGGEPGPHPIQGIGAGFVPGIYDPSVVDTVRAVEAETAYATARRMLKREGILCGISSGAICAVALEEAAKPEREGQLIVCVVCDTGERYLSTELFTPAE